MTVTHAVTLKTLFLRSLHRLEPVPSSQSTNGLLRFEVELAPKKRVAASEPAAAPPAAAAAPPAAAPGKTVVIEASKECQVFTRRRLDFEAAVRAAGANPTFVVNPERPQKGAFIVRYNGEAVLSLTGMPRPFKKLRELDMAAAGAAVAAKLGAEPKASAPGPKAEESTEPSAAPPAKKKARKA